MADVWERRKERRGARHIEPFFDLKAEIRAGAPASTTSGLEGWLARATGALNNDRTYYVLIALLILVGIAVRLPVAYDETRYFHNHWDEQSYFTQAYFQYRNDSYIHTPMPHGGSGLPLILDKLFDWTHTGPGARVDVGAAPITPAQADAARLAYVFNAMIAGAVVAAVFILARQVLPRPLVVCTVAFVAFEPFLIQQSSWLLSEAAYTVLFVLAIAAVVKANSNTAWLTVAAIMMAGSHVFRVNGLIMFLMVLAFAYLYLSRGTGEFKVRWLPIAWVLFFLVLIPYLSWRSDYLPGAFDYGTNQRYFTDDPWNFKDNYWQHYTQKTGGPRESISDYFETHTAGAAAKRFLDSIWLQWRDAFAGTTHPNGNHEKEGAAFNIVVAICMLAAFWTFWRRREFWFLPLAIAFTFVTFLWIYPVMGSSRYWMPLTPLAAVFAPLGLAWLAYRTKFPHVAGAVVLVAYAGLLALRPLARLPQLVSDLHAHPDTIGIVLTMTILILLLAFAGPLWQWNRNRA